VAYLEILLEAGMRVRSEARRLPVRAASLEARGDACDVIPAHDARSELRDSTARSDLV
jgi:hypothetical protein